METAPDAAEKTGRTGEAPAAGAGAFAWRSREHDRPKPVWEAAAS